MQANQVLQTNTIQQPETIICCKYNSQDLLLCQNKQCTNFPFKCANKKCQCQSQHPKCLKSQIYGLTLILEDKLVSFQQIEQKIKTSIQKSIDQLSRIEESLLKQIKQKSFQFSGLNEYEKKFLQAIKIRNLQGQTGKDFFNIRQNLSNSQQALTIQKLQKDIDLIWTQFQKDISKLHEKISSKLNIQGSQNLFTSSKILKTQEEVKNIEGFFSIQSQKIKNVKLLFKGSQHNFSAKSFHNLCDGQTNTITLFESTYGEKFGGFTPLPWKSQECECYYALILQESLLSFH